jgi:hypothetical protein
MTSGYNNRHVKTSNPQVETSLLSKIMPDAGTLIRVAETNRSLEEAGRRFWGDGPTGREAAARLLEQFTAARGCPGVFGLVPRAYSRGSPAIPSGLCHVASYEALPAVAAGLRRRL